MNKQNKNENISFIGFKMRIIWVIDLNLRIIIFIFCNTMSMV